MAPTATPPLKEAFCKSTISIFLPLNLNKKSLALTIQETVEILSTVARPDLLKIFLVIILLFAPFGRLI